MPCSHHCTYYSTAPTPQHLQHSTAPSTPQHLQGTKYTRAPISPIYFSLHNFLAWGGFGRLGTINPLWGSCVSEHSHGCAVRSFNFADEASTGIVRVEALSLWRCANLNAGDELSTGIVRIQALSLWCRTEFQARRCGDPACRGALAVAQ